MVNAHKLPFIYEGDSITIACNDGSEEHVLCVGNDMEVKVCWERRQKMELISITSVPETNSPPMNGDSSGNESRWNIDLLFLAIIFISA